MQSLTPLNLNLQYPNYATTIYAVQHDRLSRKITAVLSDGGTAFEPEYGTLAVVRYRKPDGTCGFYDTDEDGNDAVTWDGNVATIMLAEQALTVAGTVFCQVNFYNGDEQRLSSFTWKIIVEENVCPDSEITSSDYFNILTQQIAAIMAVITDIPAPATVLPEMDGTAATGVRGEFARADHVHPSDTAKVNVTDLATQTLTATNIMSGYTVVIKKTGNVVDILATRSSNVTLTSGWNTICTIPSGARPSTSIDFVGVDYNASGASGLSMYFRVNDSGNLNVYSYSANFSARPLCHISYVI